MVWGMGFTRIEARNPFCGKVYNPIKIQCKGRCHLNQNKIWSAFSFLRQFLFELNWPFRRQFISEKLLLSLSLFHIMLYVMCPPAFRITNRNYQKSQKLNLQQHRPLTTSLESRCKTGLLKKDFLRGAWVA